MFPQKIQIFCRTMFAPTIRPQNFKYFLRYVSFFLIFRKIYHQSTSSFSCKWRDGPLHSELSPRSFFRRWGCKSDWLPPRYPLFHCSSKNPKSSHYLWERLSLRIDRKVFFRNSWLFETPSLDRWWLHWRWNEQQKIREYSPSYTFA